MAPLCTHCLKPSLLVTGKKVYAHREDLHHLKFWECAPCGAFVGCHRPNVGYGDGTRPLGSPANAELRIARSKAHQVFDGMWKRQHKARKAAYAWLSRELGLKPEETHIAMFDLKTCHKVISLCEGLVARIP